jgi:Terminase large subunit, T4likevirus-type, N-terminal/Terminase RNaseH-like domain
MVKAPPVPKQRLFFGDPLVRRGGEVFNLTKEQLKTYLKCADDPIYFIDNFVKIITIDEGLQQIKMWKFQKKLIKVCHESNRVVLKAGRQTGKTTILAVGYLLWYALFNHDKTIGILAQKEKTAKEILNRIKNAYRNLPKWIQQGVIEWNKESIALENGSVILSESTSSGAIRGFTISLLYLDEFAFVPNNIAHDFLTSVYPTISSGKTAKIFVSSTPNGMNHFYKMVMDAKRDEKNNVAGGFKLVENTWRDRPDRDAAWVADQKRVLGEEKFLQEMECEFLGSAGALISSVALKNMAFIDAIKELLEHKLKVYEEPKPDVPYVLVADTSHGKEMDYSAFIVVDVQKSPYKIVATYKNNNISAQEYPSVIKTIAAHYNKAYVLGENNDIGAMMLNILTGDLEYENVFYSEDNKTNQEITFKNSNTPGVRTSKKTKRQGCNALKTIVESGELLITDFDIISELTTFIAKKNGTYSADEGSFDDLAMCCVLFAWLTTQQIFKDLTNSDMRKKLFDKHNEELEQEMPPLPVWVVADAKAGTVKEDGIIWEIVQDRTDSDYDLWSGYPDPKSGQRGW